MSAAAERRKVADGLARESGWQSLHAMREVLSRITRKRIKFDRWRVAKNPPALRR